MNMHGLIAGPIYIGKKTHRMIGKQKAADPVVKVLTSATFIRGMLGILKKVM
jgi:hypothetical protein